MLRGSEKGGESIFPAMTAKRREYLDLCSLPTLLYASCPGSINPQSLCTIKSPRFSSKSPQHNSNMNPERDNIVLKFSSKILQGSISLTTLDSHKSLKDNNTLKDSRSMRSKDTSLQVSSKTPRENNKSPN